MRLTGWQRVGVVVSILWALSVSSFAAYEIFKGALLDEFQFVEFVPDKDSAPVTESNPFCEINRELDPNIICEKYTRQPVKSVLNVRSVLFAAVGPILSGWFLVYVLLWVSRWVKGGFRAR